MKKLMLIVQKTKNAIKYRFKMDITEEELNKCNKLAHGGHMSWRTYAKVVTKEVDTRIRSEK